REDQQHDDIEREDVEKRRLELKKQRLDDGDVRFVEKIGDAHLLIVHRVFERGRAIGDFGDEQDKEKDVGDVKLPSAAQHLRHGVQRAAADQAPAVDQRRRVSGNEDEDLGRVEKRHRLQSKITENVFRNMVDKNQYQRQAAEKIETKIAGRGLGQGRLISEPGAA